MLAPHFLCLMAFLFYQGRFDENVAHALTLTNTDGDSMFSALNSKLYIAEPNEWTPFVYVFDGPSQFAVCIVSFHFFA